MPRTCSEKAVNAIGNRFDLILVAAARSRELRKGHKSKIETKEAANITALKEIEQGLVGKEYLKRVR